MIFRQKNSARQLHDLALTKSGNIDLQISQMIHSATYKDWASFAPTYVTR
jgi:hypothetical protein